ncbi:MAG: RidA family protein [Planctomycetota bacterium]|nr:RidA family protein [Planctomycetota bacterium]
MSPDERVPICIDNAPAAIGPYSQGIVVDGWVYCSGQIPIIPADGSVAQGIEDQTRQVLVNLGHVLSAAECDFSDVIKTTVYLADMATFSRMNEVYAQFFEDPFPARACIEAAALPKGVQVEIDAIARKRDSS